MKKTTKPRYFLARHIFPCFVDGHFVFLDLNLDEYICLDQSKTEVFHAIFPSWLNNYDLKEHVGQGENIQMNNSSEQDETFSNTILTLQKQGLLTKNRNDGKEAIPLSLNLPPLDMTGYDVGRKPDIRPSHIYRFIKASLLTTAKLHFQSLQDIIESMKHRKLKGLKKIKKHRSLNHWPLHQKNTVFLNP